MKRTRSVTGKAAPASASKYRPEYARMGYEIALLCRASEQDLARIFDVSRGTIQNWKRDFPEFAKEVERGKDLTDAKVTASLVERCLGYSHKDVHITSYKGEVTTTDIIKHYPPETTAIKFWLTNRQKEHWTETTRVENQTNVHLHKDVNLKDVSTEELMLMKKLSIRKQLLDQAKKN